jgi:V4R domain
MNNSNAKHKSRIRLAQIEFLERHPRLTKLVLKPMANASAVRDRLSVVTRVLMGARALDCYDVDLEKGEIALGGVEQLIFGSEVVEIMQGYLTDKLGEEKAAHALYRMSYETCYHYLQDIFASRQWVPADYIQIFDEPVDMEALRADPSLARIYNKMEAMLVRLVFNEAGWGNPQFDTMPIPTRVTLTNSPEAEWIGSSRKPVCHEFAGMLAGFVNYLAGERYVAREIDCAAAGASTCVFAVEKEVLGLAM